MVNKEVFIHNNALVEQGAKIGSGTRVWAFAHVLPNAIIGEDCNICDHVFIENDVKIGNRVTVKCGVYIWDGATIEDDVFLGPNVAFTNDVFPRSKQYPTEFAKIKICRGASIGANATILPNIVIGKWAMVGAGSVVTKSVPDFALVFGSPARQIGYVCICSNKLEESEKNSIIVCGECQREYYFDLNNKLQVVESDFIKL